ncbi:WYL domain-containing protein [Clostridium sp. AM58-1XD]|uniref:WYL domain-containing protein n=1 Tax=Clostridium sp. AM58-1XD TaxID=2292307 RepID=UPI000E4C3F58|nr:WYL domain-containing protein [Clostridium sp. AM58-1XD]RGY97584.1 WYL domain-containing protein [Clostridium sp. AM58-1XD]
MKSLELFDKVYNCYYQVVRKILEEAAASPISAARMEEICRELAFEESALAILPRLTCGSWSALLSAEGKTMFSSALSSGRLSVPFTSLQKSWLKSLLSDDRISLFFTEKELELLSSSLHDVEPLFHTEDFHYYDRFHDGDPYKDSTYLTIFQTVLSAFETKQILLLSYGGKNQEPVVMEAAPCRLQYSSKDDKFRLFCMKRTKRGFSVPFTLNIGRILDCRLSPEKLPSSFRPDNAVFRSLNSEPVCIEIDGRRNSLERCMLHFANYEKHTEYDEDRHVYLCSIYYDPSDETELLIELLSFGPVIRILGPETMLKQIRERVQRQHDLLYGTI